MHSTLSLSHSFMLDINLECVLSSDIFIWSLTIFNHLIVTAVMLWTCLPTIYFSSAFIHFVIILFSVLDSFFLPFGYSAIIYSFYYSFIHSFFHSITIGSVTLLFIHSFILLPFILFFHVFFITSFYHSSLCLRSFMHSAILFFIQSI